MDMRRRLAGSTQLITRAGWLLVVVFALINSGCSGLVSSKSPLSNTTPPTVSITSPASGATVSGRITVAATAADNVGVASVQFQVDGSNLGAAVTAAPYSQSLNTATLANGKHNLTAIAVDTSGNKTTSTAVSVTMNNAPDTTPPTVSITAPASGATVSGTITVAATAADNVGVASVQFQVDGSNLGAAVTAALYSQSLNTATLANGKHNLTAVAADTSGNKATSAAVSITVNNTSTTPLTASITSPVPGATVSGTVTVVATATASDAITGVQFLLDGANLGSKVTSSPYSISWDTTKTSNGSHVLSAQVSDQAGKTAISSNVNVTVSQSSTPPPPAGDDITISDTSGSAQTNRPVSISRPFVQGEIPNFAQASTNGTPLLTQCDVKNRWPDGSLKFAVVSFIIPSIPAHGSIVVSFSNQTSGNNTGFLAATDMLAPAFNFDGEIQLSGSISRSISARAILNAASSCNDPGNDPDGGKYLCSYWLKGPIVTAVILEDRTTRNFDVNTDSSTGNPLHPIFEAWFYPQGNLVQLGYTLENSWASTTPTNSARDQTYSLVLTGGNSTPMQVFNNQGSSFTQITRSRWHKTYCVNGLGAGNANACGPTMHVNQNWGYLAQTKFLPHWDTTLSLASSLITGDTNGFSSNTQAQLLQGCSSCVEGSAGIGYFQTALNATGSSAWHGPLTKWDIEYLISQDDGLRNVMLANADLGGRIPYFFREADANAGHGQHFDAAGTVGTQGRVVSINARTQVSLDDVTTQNCNTNYPTDWINFGTGGQDYGGWDHDTTHMPNLAYASYLSTGQYAYYEEQILQSAYVLADSPGTRACNIPNYSGSLRMGSAGYWYIDQERGNDWAARENAIGAFIAVDGSPEKAYFEDKLKGNIAVWEGTHGIANDVSGNYSAAWTFGNAQRNGRYSGNGLYSWTRGVCSPQTTPNCYVTGNDVNSSGTNEPMEANSHFQNAYSGYVIGFINDLGYCPGNCAILQYAANFWINLAMDPNSSVYTFADYVYPTADNHDNPLTSWVGFLSYYDPTKILTSWKSCSPPAYANYDEVYEAEGMTVLSYAYKLTSNEGYKGSDAYNKVRAGMCVTGPVSFQTSSPKWDITPR
jgi:hypothetical protein